MPHYDVEITSNPAPRAVEITVGVPKPPAAASRLDVVSPTVAYRADSMIAGAADDAPVWRIRKVAINFNPLSSTTTWPDGDTNFTRKWSDRATYDYSAAP